MKRIRMEDRVQDGYPEAGDFEALEAYEADVRDWAAHVSALVYNTGYGRLTSHRALDRLHGHVLEYRFVTGGWSGAEEIADWLSRTLFHHAFWEFTSRGGLITYTVPWDQTSKVAQWGVRIG